MHLNLQWQEEKKFKRLTLRDYVTSGAHSQTTRITIPPVAANNFELKPAMILMVQ